MWNANSNTMGCCLDETSVYSDKENGKLIKIKETLN